MTHACGICDEVVAWTSIGSFRRVPRFRAIGTTVEGSLKVLSRRCAPSVEDWRSRLASSSAYMQIPLPAPLEAPYRERELLGERALPST
jgi:hypothetical protein